LQDADLIKAALDEGARAAMRLFRNNPKQWLKKDGSIVTEGDLAVNEAMAQVLRQGRPDYGWLSEEGPDDDSRLAKQRCWILDPIDGTNTFARGHDGWCIGLALVEDGEVLACGVSMPVLGHFYSATRGQGAMRNGLGLQAGTGAALQDARLAGNASALKRLSGTGGLHMDVGGTPQIARLSKLAAAEFDVVVSFGHKHDWDIAPGALLVTEAGGKITDEQGQPMVFNRASPRQNGIVAAGLARHATVMKALEKTKP
jgi:myo-inositol-1(or 4)-monophosphatase